MVLIRRLFPRCIQLVVDIDRSGADGGRSIGGGHTRADDDESVGEASHVQVAKRRCNPRHRSIIAAAALERLPLLPLVRCHLYDARAAHLCGQRPRPGADGLLVRLQQAGYTRELRHPLAWLTTPLPHPRVRRFVLVQRWHGAELAALGARVRGIGADDALLRDCGV